MDGNLPGLLVAPLHVYGIERCCHYLQRPLPLHFFEPTVASSRALVLHLSSEATDPDVLLTLVPLLCIVKTSNTVGFLIFCINVQVSPELFVDTARDQKTRINMAVYFPKLPCVCKYLR